MEVARERQPEPKRERSLFDILEATGFNPVSLLFFCGTKRVNKIEVVNDPRQRGSTMTFYGRADYQPVYDEPGRKRGGKNFTGLRVRKTKTGKVAEKIMEWHKEGQRVYGKGYSIKTGKSRVGPWIHDHNGRYKVVTKHGVCIRVSPVRN